MDDKRQAIVREVQNGMAAALRLSPRDYPLTPERITKAREDVVAHLTKMQADGKLGAKLRFTGIAVREGKYDPSKLRVDFPEALHEELLGIKKE